MLVVVVNSFFIYNILRGGGGLGRGWMDGDDDDDKQ